MDLTYEGDTLRWNYADRDIKLLLSGVVSAVVDEKHQRVLAVVSDKQRGDQLFAFSFTGKSLLRVSSPENGRIYYLTTHPVHGALVVLTHNKPVDGWQDWHYSIEEDGELTRLTPAY